ncbi:MAG: trypsin-like peptidase domain-containing protein [Myxococcaceae bacterium]
MKTPLLCLALAGLASTARASDGGTGLDGWLKARAEEQEAFLRSQTTPRPAATDQLFRERPAGEPVLPEFIPPTSLAPLIRAVRPGVVNVSTVNAASKQGGAAQGRSLGSGFIISPDGYVVTNSHVVEKAQQIQVKLADGRELLATLVGSDPSTDLALLKISESGAAALPFTFLGDSDKLQVGDWVLAIGNPFGLDHSVSHGMISAKERVIGVGLFDDFIQTDASINPGNSGGPLFNTRGEVIGVNTAKLSQGQGIGFAVPINMVKDLLPNLRVNGRLARGWLGVNVREHSASDASHRGAVVMDVFKGSPAATAGLKPGDRLTAVNGRPIETYLQLLRRIALLAPGSEARIAVLRGGTSREVTVRLVERPSPEGLQLLGGAGRVSELGVVVRELGAEVAKGLGLEAFSGVLVAAVVPDGPAAQAGLVAGDLVTEVNRKKVPDIGAFRAALALTEAGQPALLRLQRGEVTRYLAVKPGG